MLQKLHGVNLICIILLSNSAIYLRHPNPYSKKQAKEIYRYNDEVLVKLGDVHISCAFHLHTSPTACMIRYIVNKGTNWEREEMQGGSGSGSGTDTKPKDCKVLCACLFASLAHAMAACRSC